MFTINILFIDIPNLLSNEIVAKQTASNLNHKPSFQKIKEYKDGEILEVNDLDNFDVELTNERLSPVNLMISQQRKYRENKRGNHSYFLMNFRIIYITKRL